MSVTLRAQLNPRLRTLDELFEMTPAMAKAATDRVDRRFRAHERALFASEGAHGGPRWKPLSPAYARAKERRRPGRKILVDKGDMRRAFTQRGGRHIAQWSRTNPGASFRVGRGGAIRVLAASPSRWYIRIGVRGRVPVFHIRNKARRNPMQHRPEQWRAYHTEIERALWPHVQRAIRAADTLEATG